MSDAATEKNAAWVQAEIPLAPAELLAFLARSERLWRLNPYLVIDQWRNAEDGGFAYRALNEANGCQVDVAVRRETLADRGLRFSYDRGIKQTTEFIVAAQGNASLLTVTERYLPLDAADDPRVKETDNSLVPWIATLRRHIVARRRWRRVPGWQWWSETFLPSLAPKQRRIARMIVWFSVIEFVIFVALILGLRFL